VGRGDPWRSTRHITLGLNRDSGRARGVHDEVGAQSCRLAGVAVAAVQPDAGHPRAVEPGEQPADGRAVEQLDSGARQHAPARAPFD
jgi:hypothetical protein